jgi:hypothetical protein
VFDQHSPIRWFFARSGDDHFEILVSPVIADSMRVAGILAHELIHASVGVEHGHKGPFRQMAKALGLEGKMTATTEGEAFKRLLTPIPWKRSDPTRMPNCTR